MLLLDVIILSSGFSDFPSLVPRLQAYPHLHVVLVTRPTNLLPSQSTQVQHASPATDSMVEAYKYASRGQLSFWTLDPSLPAVLAEQLAARASARLNDISKEDQITHIDYYIPFQALSSVRKERDHLKPRTFNKLGILIDPGRGKPATAPSHPGVVASLQALLAALETAITQDPGYWGYVQSTAISGGAASRHFFRRRDDVDVPFQVHVFVREAAGKVFTNQGLKVPTRLRQIVHIHAQAKADVRHVYYQLSTMVSVRRPGKG